MIHQRQGRLECLPTTVGMLLNIPKDQVIRDTFQKLKWQFPSWEYALMQLAMGHQSVLDNLTRTVLGWVPWINFLDLDRAHFEKRCIDTQIDPLYMLRRRGIITTRHEKGGGHIVAFENNLIFDPDAQHEISFSYWEARNRLFGFHCEHWMEEPQHYNFTEELCGEKSAS